MLKHISKIYSFSRDEYRKHLFRSRISYLLNYLNLLFSSYFCRNRKIIAVSLIEHIGDIIANEPISRDIRIRHPDSTIVWFVRKPFKELVKYNPNIDKVLVVYCLTTWIKISEKIKFEKIYDLHFNGRSCNLCHVQLKKENVDDSINSTNYFNYGGLLKAVCLHNKMELSDTVPRMYIPNETKIHYKRYIPKRKFVIFHCSANEPIKDWEIGKWNKLAEVMINSYNYSVVEVGLVNKLSIKSGFYYNLCGRLSILQTAAIIRESDLFIGIDSGPAHMANAVGTAGVILLGEYFFGMKNYNPFSGNYSSSEKCRLIHSTGTVQDIPLELVLTNVDALLCVSNSII